MVKILDKKDKVTDEILTLGPSTFLIALNKFEYYKNEYEIIDEKFVKFLQKNCKINPWDENGSVNYFWALDHNSKVKPLKFSKDKDEPDKFNYFSFYPSDTDECDLILIRKNKAKKLNRKNWPTHVYFGEFTNNDYDIISDIIMNSEYSEDYALMDSYNLADIGYTDGLYVVPWDGVGWEIYDITTKRKCGGSLSPNDKFKLILEYKDHMRNNCRDSKANTKHGVTLKTLELREY